MGITLIVGFGRMTLYNPINKQLYVLKEHLFFLSIVGVNILSKAKYKIIF